MGDNSGAIKALRMTEPMPYRFARIPSRANYVRVPAPPSQPVTCHLCGLDLHKPLGLHAFDCPHVGWDGKMYRAADEYVLGEAAGWLGWPDVLRIPRAMYFRMYGYVTSDLRRSFGMGSTDGGQLQWCGPNGPMMLRPWDSDGIAAGGGG